MSSHYAHTKIIDFDRTPVKEPEIISTDKKIGKWDVSYVADEFGIISMSASMNIGKIPGNPKYGSFVSLGGPMHPSVKRLAQGNEAVIEVKVQSTTGLLPKWKGMKVSLASKYGGSLQGFDFCEVDDQKEYFSEAYRQTHSGQYSRVFPDSSIVSVAEFFDSIEACKEFDAMIKSMDAHVSKITESVKLEK
jgi:hypothetical protein